MLPAALDRGGFLAAEAFIHCGFVLGAAGMALAGRRDDASQRRKRWIKFATYYLIVQCVALATSRTPAFVAVAVIVALASSWEFHSVARQRAVSSRMTRTLRIVFGAEAVCLVVFAALAPPPLSLYVYLLIASLDAFSQIWGQLLGGRPLAPRISPRKTVAGAVGGAASTIAAALLLRSVPHVTALHAVGLAIVLAASGITGDLLASWYKRIHGVTDFSRLLPGQGGVVDRFNSLLAASPVMTVIALMLL